MNLKNELSYEQEIEILDSLLENIYSPIFMVDKGLVSYANSLFIRFCIFKN